MDGVYQNLRLIVERVAGELGGSASTDKTDPVAVDGHEDGDEKITFVPVSITLIKLSRCAPVEVPLKRLGEFLDKVGAEIVESGLVDAQFWLQRRLSKKDSRSAHAKDRPRLHGIVLDIDVRLDDAVSAIAQAGLPTPNFVFDTQHGHRAGWIFDRELDDREHRTLGKIGALALPGADLSSAEPLQAQRLPTCTRADQGLETISFPVRQLNSAPVDPGRFFERFPRRIEEALGFSSALTEAEQEEVRAYLDSVGTLVPDTPGRVLGRRCPEKEHSKSCVYTSLDDDGAISIYCCGGHDGGGGRRWDEFDLHTLATGRLHPAGKFDPLEEIPVTHAGVSFIRHKLQQLFAEEKDKVERLKAALDVWLELAAHREQQRLLGAAERLAAREGIEEVPAPDLDRILWLYHRRLHGIDKAGPTPLHFNWFAKELRLGSSTGETYRINIKKAVTLSQKNYAHERASTAAVVLRPTVIETKSGDETVQKIVYKEGEIAHIESHFNKTLVGYPPCLGVLGVPRVSVYDFPVAHVREDWLFNPDYKNIDAVIPSPVPPAQPGFDAIDFVLNIFRAGELPLATEEDARRFVMAIASPLLRHHLSGQLGIYWFLGPSGVGKEFMCAVLTEIWASVGIDAANAAIDLPEVGEDELRKTFATAGDVAYARAKEAGKNLKGINLLIRLAGTDKVSARGIYRDEITVENSYTILADSVEGLPDRREIRRRTVTIELAPMDDAISKGEVLSRIRESGPATIADLKNLVEQHPVDWFRHQATTGGRPLAPIALARLVGANMDPVVTGALPDLFGAMHDYVHSHCQDEAEHNRLRFRPGKDAKDLAKLHTYRLAHFIDTMSAVVGHKEAMRRYHSARLVSLALDRETDYAAVRRKEKPYHRVTLDGQGYAFKLVRSGRDFVFMKEAEYRGALGLEPLATGAPEECDAVPVEDPPTEAPAPSPPASPDDLSFSDAELLDPEGGEG